jgi:hypothetical protein
MLPCNDGEVLIVTGAQLFKTSGWAANPETATLVEKSAVTGGGDGYLEWGVDGDGEHFIIVPYAGGNQGSDAWGASRYVKISVDEGDTWTTIYDGVEEYGETQNKQSHLHAAAYDPETDTFFLGRGPRHATRNLLYGRRWRYVSAN